MPRAFAVCFGALAALGQEPFSLWVLTPLGFAAAMVLAVAALGVRSAAAVGWATGLGYFLVSLHWLVEPFLVDVARHGWMAPFALIGMSGGLALFWAAAFGAAAWCCAPRWRLFALVVTMTLAEFLRSTVLTGFPWALPAYVWSETPVIHVASLIGPHGLDLLTFLVAAGFAAAARRGWSLIWAVGGAVPLVLVALFGWWQAQARLVELDDPPIVRLVQPNVPQREKWDPDRATTFVDRQIALSATAPAPDLIVWPETAIPWTLDSAGPVLARAAEAAHGAPVILGVTRIDGARIFNSLAVIGPEGEVLDVYDKHHLVPFGEFIPLGGLGRVLGLQSFAAQDGYGFSQGVGRRLLDLGWIGRPLPLICYEAIFPDEVGGGERPDWLLQITNDAWFGTFSGPYQHLAQARFRAVEQGLPMIRVANTGVSAVIDARGRVVTSLPLGQAGYVDAALPPPDRPTLYARTGDLPVMLGVLAMFTGLAIYRNAR